jgi:uroporphyrinogen decarboxylase
MIKGDNKLLLTALQKRKANRAPFWFMRQAGRYLPEYRQLRSRHKNFLEFCYTPEAASEATLQPIHRFGMDGAIIFSDILVVPHALGANVRFEEGHGPILEPIRTAEALKKLNANELEIKLAPVYQALKLTRAALPGEVALIGFVGAPWTIACYMVEGKSSKDFAQVKALENQLFFPDMINILTEAAIQHAIHQIEAGAEIIQIFDSWAGLLGGESYRQWVINPTKKIVAALKAKFPQVPVIGFPRQSGSKFLDYARETGVNAVSFDDSVPLDWVKNSLQPHMVVQGCLNPQLLANDKKAAIDETRNIIAALRDKPFVFNLGHGILPHTPIENVQAICEFIKHPS